MRNYSFISLIIILFCSACPAFSQEKAYDGSEVIPQAASCVGSYAGQTVSSVVNVNGCSTLGVQHVTVTGTGKLTLAAMALHAQTYIPGNFSGSLDISPMGGATYSIPLDLPPGIDPLIPRTGIVYNSQGRDGVMGKGKDGLVYKYGKTSDSKLFAQGNNSGQVAAWMLNRVSDRLGRYYTYTY
ncbi:MAG: hypothetical protein LBS04_00930, partial [Tannerellaceae bacterium]|nr:hypothetical protein [Tannerellaceae bacterium]